MIDRPARDKMAELLRHLASGSITIGEFGEAMPDDSQDPAIAGATGFCRQLHKLLYRREGFRRMHQNQSGADDEMCMGCRFDGEHALTREQLRAVERLILFLRSDLEYEWQGKGSSTNLKWWQACLIVPAIVLTAILWGIIAEATSPRIAIWAVIAVAVVIYMIWGAERVWPFRHRSEYRAALGASRPRGHRD